MARIDEALFSQLSADAALTALVGDNPPRIWPLVLPEKPTMPALTYQQVTGSRESALASDVGLAHGTFQFDAWAMTYNAAREVADAMLAVLQRADFTAAGVSVLDALIESERMLHEDASRLYRVSVDLVIWWRE